MSSLFEKIFFASSVYSSALSYPNEASSSIRSPSSALCEVVSSGPLIYAGFPLGRSTIGVSLIRLRMILLSWDSLILAVVLFVVLILRISSLNNFDHAVARSVSLFFKFALPPYCKLM